MGKTANAGEKQNVEKEMLVKQVATSSRNSLTMVAILGEVLLRTDGI